MTVLTVRRRSGVPGPRGSHHDEGLSLIEVLVSLFILAVVMTAAASFFLNSLRTTNGQSQRQTAITLANQALEKTQSQTPAALLAGRTQASVQALLATSGAAVLTAQDNTTSGNYDPSPVGAEVVPTSTTSIVNGTTYTIRTFIDICYLPTGGTICGASSSAGATQLYRITVDVSWTGKAGTLCASSCDYSASTIIDAHGEPTFNTNISTPHITNISPSATAVNTTKRLTITGTGFVSGATVQLSGSAGTFSAVVSNSGIQLVIDLTAGSTSGSYTLYLINPDGGRTSTTYTITPAPAVTSITPTSGRPPGSTNVTLVGTGFQNGATMTMTGGAVTAVNWVSSTQMTATFTPDGTLEGTNATTVTITNPDSGVGTAPWTVNPSAPTITSVSPASVVAGVAKSVTITGTNFMNAPTLTMTQGTVSSVAYVNATTLTAIVTASAGASGTATFTVVNPDTGTGSGGSITINPAPKITSIAPGSATVGVAKTITLTGANFQAGATIAIAKGTVSGATWVNSTTLTASVTIGAGQSGTDTFTVTNPDGGSATGGVLTIVPAPTVTSVSPNFATENVSKAVTITGANFQSGATVTFSKGTLTGVTYVNATTITASVKVTIGQSGTGQFTVTNPDGGTGTGASLTIIPRPTFSGIGRADTGLMKAAHGSTHSLAITGNGFVNGSVITVSGGGSVGSTTFQDSNDLTVNYTWAAPAGTNTITFTVTNPDGGTSSTSISVQST
ncbi:MAG: IPT/TIG domain-containing protein [Actinomycetota bacterium]|nr:IPT/TIG domain-containing protein [Actinomycetota bacterium]